MADKRDAPAFGHSKGDAVDYSSPIIVLSGPVRCNCSHGILT
jgi:hypothetical protein